MQALTCALTILLRIHIKALLSQFFHSSLHSSDFLHAHHTMAPKRASRPPAHRSRHRNAESSRKKQQRKSSSKPQHHRRPATSSDESRDEGRSRHLSANALADLNRENGRQRPRADRPRRPARAEYREARQQTPDSPRQTPRTKKKRRVVSGAVMEEGRVRSGLRGGHGEWSEESWDKADYYARPPRRKKSSKKKLCQYSTYSRGRTRTTSNSLSQGILLGA